MIKNYLKTTLRHLWRARLFTALNIFGLAIGISACWIIYRIVDHEFSYDAALPNKENIYQVVSSFSADNKMAGVGAPLYQGVRAEIPGLDQVVPVFFQRINNAEIKRNANDVFIKEDPQRIVATDISYFNMLPYTWLAGDKSTALAAPESVVLTEHRAREYFPSTMFETILGRTITYYSRDTVQRTVTGIVADYHTPSEFIAQEFFTLPERAYGLNTWTNTNGSDKLYLQFKKETNVEATLALINELDARHWKAFGEERGEELERGRSYELVPINEIHFATTVRDYYGVTKTSKAVLFGLIGIGIFLLLLACINYINMSVAQIPQRGKEIGVRKTLGGGRWQLISQFIVETLMTVIIATLLAFVFTRLGFWLLDDMMPDGLGNSGKVVSFVGAILGLVLITTILAGLYPGWLITKVRTINVFKSQFDPASSNRGFNLQKALIVFQFSTALVFIISSIIVGSQLRHTLKADLGFDKEAIVLVSVPWKYASNAAYQGKQLTLFHELSNLPGIEAIAMGMAPLSSGYSSSPFSAEDTLPMEVQTFKKTIDHHYLNLYQMELVAGRNIRETDTISEFIINETAAKAFGFASPQEAVGKLIRQIGNSSHPIVGVVKDFHTQDFYTPITPLAMMMEKRGLSSFNIRLNSVDPSTWQHTIKAIQEKYASFYLSESFQISFYDETLEAMYQQERQVAKLINLATAITILVSCLGLFGLATLTTFQRTKEIGIRKVLGATVSSIVTMLSKDFAALVLIAAVIASPIAWWAMNKWLEDFAYRIDIEWWMFAVACLAAVVIALLTVSWQAIRAAVANPVDSLRDE